MTPLIAAPLKTLIGYALYATPWPRSYLKDKYVITAFHRVNTTTLGDGITCSPDRFRKICKWLAKNFNVVPLAEQIEALETGRPLRNTASITFDDGYLDNYEVAAPILLELGLPATFFVATEFLGTDVVPFWDEDKELRTKWMTWDHVRELSKQGFHVESHTCTHIDLGSADAESAREELRRSLAQLVNSIGSSQRLFAYPFGGTRNITERTRALIREEGYRCCLSCYGGINTATAEAFSLNRIPVNEEYVSGYQFGLEILRSAVNGPARPLPQQNVAGNCA
jgi:peptidoglycan/xylan/chitin deacetylase (PgdA/CDA1 family)